MSKRVLIVDDEEDARAIMRLALEMRTDWEIITAGSGTEALELAAFHQPDVILLDMMMPKMDGRMTLDCLKADHTTQKIPVILVTAKANSSSQDSLSKLDIVAVLAKPLRPLELAAQIQDILEKSPLI